MKFINAKTEGIEPRKPGWLLKILATFITLMHIFLALIIGSLNAIGLGVVYSAIGHLTALFLTVFLVVGFFQMFRKLRNRRSRLKVYTWSLFVLLIPVLFGVVDTLLSLAVGHL